MVLNICWMPVVFIFYNQPESPCKSIRMAENKSGYEKVFGIDLNALPSKIQKLVFTATIDGNGTMSQTAQSELALMVDGSPMMRFPFDGSAFGQEKALMVAEVYMKTVWRIAAVGQGFNGGLAALLKHFGGEVADEAPAPAPAPAAKPAPAPAAAPRGPAKITLEKRGQSQKVSLKKGGSSTIHINLNWDAQTQKRSFFGGGGTTDLDLGCMWELENGYKGVIQPLGNSFGSRHDFPYIELDKDDRSGAATDGENMRILKPEIIKRVLVFAMIYEGSANFTQVNGRVTIKDQQGNEILVKCDAPDSSRTFCAVCMIEKSGDGIKITKEENYFTGARDCDMRYGFGFRWTAGRK